MELIWAVLGLSWVPVWQSWESLGFGRLRGHLGLSWGSPGPSRGPLGRLGRGLVGPSFFLQGTAGSGVQTHSFLRGIAVSGARPLIICRRKGGGGACIWAR